MKHAFAGRERGRVLLRLRAGATEHEVSVEDDGVGDAAGEAAAPGRKGLGLEIVETLVAHDLKGRFERRATPGGTRAVIRFPAATGTEEGAAP